MHDEIPPSSLGLLRCLQALAEETAHLGLVTTYVAIQDAINACRVESGVGLSHLVPSRVPLLN